MAAKDIKIQAEIEREMLSHIENGLRTVLAWHTEGVDYSRKLSTLRFIAQSFERHLDRVQSLDEHDGFIPMVLDNKPHLKPHIEDLKTRRNEERGRVQRIVELVDANGIPDICDLWFVPQLLEIPVNNDDFDRRAIDIDGNTQHLDHRDTQHTGGYNPVTHRRERLVTPGDRQGDQPVLVRVFGIGRDALTGTAAPDDPAAVTVDKTRPQRARHGDQRTAALRTWMPGCFGIDLGQIGQTGNRSAGGNRKGRHHQKND